jgi:AbrB family looped-hinge helix DNA binding protein
MVSQQQPSRHKGASETELGNATITSKGQITLPKKLRDRAGLKQGDEVKFVEDRHGIRILRNLDPDRFRKWRGFGKGLKGEDIDRVIDEMRGRDPRR